MKKALCFALLLMMSTAAGAQSPARAQILVLATFHMSNPGRDVHNMEADDMLSPKRQQEISELIEVLKRYHPTKIAVEADVGNQSGYVRQYSAYVAGKYQLSRNEVEQIGYRLAKELGHAAVYAVDVDGDFPLIRVHNYAKANGMTEQFDALQAKIGRQVKEESDFLRSHSVLEMLEYLNADSLAARGVADYFAQVRYGEPWEYAGPDLLASWYQRNIRIYHNITALVESPNDRILVIYGAGHLGWLRQDVANDATVELRKLSDLTAGR
jgi:hypothetical protein